MLWFKIWWQAWKGHSWCLRWRREVASLEGTLPVLAVAKGGGQAWKGHSWCLPWRREVGRNWLRKTKHPGANCCTQVAPQSFKYNQFRQAFVYSSFYLEDKVVKLSVTVKCYHSWPYLSPSSVLLLPPFPNTSRCLR